MTELYIFISVHLSSSYIMLGKEFPIVVWSRDGKKIFSEFMDTEARSSSRRRPKKQKCWNIKKKSHLFCIIDKVLT